MKRTTTYLTLLIALALTTAAHAADISWDPGGAPNDGVITDGGAQWNTSDPTWTTDGGVTNFSWNNTTNALDTAVFGAGGSGGFTVQGTNGLQAGSMTVLTDYRFDIWGVTLNIGEIDVASGATAQVDFGLGGSNGITKTGSGTLRFNGPKSFSGGLFINDGTVLVADNSAGNIINPASGDVHLLDTTGSADATLDLSNNNNAWIVPNDIIVRSGSTGTATMINDKASGDGTGEFAGDIVLNNDLLIQSGSGSGVTVTISGDISGDGRLTLDHSAFDGHDVVLTGNNTQTSDLVFLGRNDPNHLTINGTQSHSNISMDRGILNGSGTLTYNIDSPTTADMISLLNGAGADLSGLSLDVNYDPFPSDFWEAEYVLIDNNANVTGEFASVSSHPRYWVDYVIDYDGTATHPNAVTLSVVFTPEPTSMSLLLLGAAGLLRHRRRS